MENMIAASDARALSERDYSVVFSDFVKRGYAFVYDLDVQPRMKFYEFLIEYHIILQNK